jgi:hypothetical protein
MIMRKHCDTCGHYDFGEYCKHCEWPEGKPPSKWKPVEWWKPDTNADRIRAMSDEELAEEFHAIMLGWNEWCDYHCENRGDDGCDKCILKWLKQPAEEETDERMPEK